MATNGCQLGITSGLGSTVTVRGKNQNNQPSEWQGAADSNGMCVTHNWWWKGPVEITSRLHGVPHHKQVDVPSFNIQDTYYVIMPTIP
jgi:hypothetical protein